MTPSESETPTPDGPHDTGNPAEAMPARTTPTWEIEILLSGASAFALFQTYDALQKGLFDLIRRLSPEMVGLASALGTYLMTGVMALALGFIAHLAVRAFWAAAVGLHSIDPTGGLSRTRTVGPVQRALLAERWARMPQRIAELDDWATIVFAVSLGLAKMMIGLIVGFLVAYGVAAGVAAASGGVVSIDAALIGLLVLLLGPYLAATLVDGQRGKKNLPALPWTRRVLSLYAAAGMTSEHNLGLQMMVHRISSGERSYKGVIVTTLIMSILMIVVLVVPIIDRLGVGTLLRGEFPALQAGQPQALRSVHYLDRLPTDEVLKSPVIPSEVAKSGYLRLFIPYFAHWHDALLERCLGDHEKKRLDRDDAERTDWRLDPAINAAVLDCVAKTLPITLDGQPVTAPWVFAEDRRRDHRGFVVMIDLRDLPRGRHELAVTQPPEALFEDEPVVPWRIPFWL